MATFGELLSNGRERLQQCGVGNAALEARILLLHAAGLAQSEMISRQNETCPFEVGVNYGKMIGQRIGGKPVYRIVGSREFHGLEFMLSPETLEPRDDTEALIELVLDRVGDRQKALRFVDLGSGTGAIALSLLSELPQANCIATDISQDALETVRVNALKNGFEHRVETKTGAWFQPLCEKFDFIVSNPPYIASGVVDNLAREVLEHDPRVALDGGTDGLDAYREILKGGMEHLEPGGFLAVEIGFDQKRQVIRIAKENEWRLLAARRDMGGNDRALCFGV